MATEKDAVKKKEKRPSALKRDLQSEKRRIRNRLYKSQVRTTVRQLDDILAKKDAELTQASLSEAYSILDKCVKAGVYKINKASRTKARLAARVAAAKA